MTGLIYRRKTISDIYWWKCVVTYQDYCCHVAVVNKKRQFCILILSQFNFFPFGQLFAKNNKWHNHLSLSTTALKIFHVSMSTFSQEWLKIADLSRMQEACHMWTLWWPNPPRSRLLFGRWWSIESGTPSLESAFDFWWKFWFFCPTLVTIPITFDSVNQMSSSENYPSFSFYLPTHSVL